MKRFLIVLFGVLVFQGSESVQAINFGADALLERMKDTVQSFSYGVSDSFDTLTREVDNYIDNSTPPIKSGVKSMGECENLYWKTTEQTPARFYFPPRKGLSSDSYWKHAKGSALGLAWEPQPLNVSDGDEVNVTLHKFDGSKVLPDLGLRGIANSGSLIVPGKNLRGKHLLIGQEGWHYYFQIENASNPDIYIRSECFHFAENINKTRNRLAGKVTRENLHALSGMHSDVTHRVSELEHLVNVLILQSETHLLMIKQLCAAGLIEMGRQWFHDACGRLN
jgi:hypothetical protein